MKKAITHTSMLVEGRTIEGTAGDDVFDGYSEDATFVGGAGHDIYWVTTGDTVVEAPGGGAEDWVFSFGDYTLAAGAEVEVLGTDDVTGTLATNLTGNEFNNMIVGNQGVNTLSGGDGRDRIRAYDGDDTLIGGAGNDDLTGGAGSDTFVFDAALGAGNVDRILDFSSAADRIALDDAVFTGLTDGSFPDAFSVGTSAADANDRVIYDNGTGALYFDVDGVGGADAILFANIGAGLSDLSGANFFVM